MQASLARNTRPQRTTAATSSTAAQVVRRQRLAAAVDPGLHGRRAAAWLPEWDRGSRSTRARLLEAFLSLHAHSTSEAVAQDLGDAAPLLFARVTSWLRLTYCELRPREAAGLTTAAAAAAATGATAREGAPSPLLLMAQTLAVFVRGATYATQFVEAGVAFTLTDCLERGAAPLSAANEFQPLRREEKTAVLLLLLYVANAGRVYREMIADEDGLERLLRVMRVETDESVAALLTELFVLLGKGHPQLAVSVQWGLARLVIAHYAQKTQTTGEASAPGGVTGDASGESVVAVLEAARALRGLQLHKQAHHYSSCREQQQLQGPQSELSLGGSSGDGPVSASGVPLLDCVPVVCCLPDDVAAAHEGDTARRRGGARTGAEDDPLRPVSARAFLRALFRLALDDNTRLCVEGSELLVMAARSAELMPQVLNRALDVLDDDMLVIGDVQDAELVARRHRSQLSCGRVAVQVVLTTPMTSYRRRALVDLIALRCAHMSLVKYLRLTDLGDSAAVVDGCRALQVLARASDQAQRAGMPESPGVVALHGTRVSGHSGAGTAASTSAVLKMGHAIRAALGPDLYEVLLHDTITEEESFAMLRAARSSAMSAMAW